MNDSEWILGIFVKEFDWYKYRIYDMLVSIKLLFILRNITAENCTVYSSPRCTMSHQTPNWFQNSRNLNTEFIVRYCDIYWLCQPCNRCEKHSLSTHYDVLCHIKYWTSIKVYALVGTNFTSDLFSLKFWDRKSVV